ncbi:retron St85 family RNA-directed DNA polymerase [Peribacillus sp. NPDC097895]|uniref:retron St85 family RNA-directed DNA polymerase n=1 Tax=Peribacillus sp. NPDC097895 TaxID=3390619 RepID=UPI003CFDD08E
MKKDFTNSFILYSLDLPIIKDFESLSNSIGISKTMLYLLSKKPEMFYNSFYIFKRNGTKREINSPKYSLKLVQRWILAEILEKIKVTNESMAFRKGIGNGSKKNAEHHKYSLYLLQLDIKDFFTTIKRERVFYFFKSLGYNSLVSNILTNLCTYKGYLPQGGVCSPYISNLICYKLDKRLKGLSSKRDVLYTRYADDLTFSCDNKVILRKMESVIKDIIIDEGFIINPSKTRLLSPSSHKKVTGITVNDNKLKANKQLKKTVRAMIHNALVSGDYSKKNIIRGYISYIDSIEEGYVEKIKTYTNNLIEKDYKYFSETVEAFNKNKIFKDLNEMVYNENILMGIDDEYELHLFEQERYQFLKERRYIEEIIEETLQQTGATNQEDEFNF